MFPAENCPAIEYDSWGCYNYGEPECAENEQKCIFGFDEKVMRLKQRIQL